MDIKTKLVESGIKHYKLVTLVMVVLTLALAACLPLITVDTDPENMLAADTPVRVFHHQTKARFNLSDIVVLGIINESDPDGVFNPATLQNIYTLTQYAKTLRWQDKKNPDEIAGVKAIDIIAPSNVDHIQQSGPGEVTFEWLMAQPPKTRKEALIVRDRALSNPLLKGTLVSEDGKALCLYLPLTNKNVSYKVYKSLREKIATLQDSGKDQFFITGLPVAEDTFGVEMFIQMAISAPLAMFTIFILMLIFFRKLVLIISPMIVAMVSVISTMGLLIGMGYPVHIMSSMIPIFLMPIAVVDSIHILSEFFDLYTPEKGRQNTIREVMSHLFTPMLFTSLTSAAGFASLSLTPIPPVQVFGIFVAIGIMTAWVWTILFVPAYVMMIPEKSLANFGATATHGETNSPLARILDRLGGWTVIHSKSIIAVICMLVGVAVYGITQIRINDNPVKWFSHSHPIRQADTILNKHFGGTYMAYLVLDYNDKDKVDEAFRQSLLEKLRRHAQAVKEDVPRLADILPQVRKLLNLAAAGTQTKEKYLAHLSEMAAKNSDTAQDNDVGDAWYELADFFDLEKERLKTFKQPEVLRYIGKLQNYIATIKSGNRKLVGKSNSIGDVVKKVYQELTDGSEKNFRIPDTFQAVAQCLMQFQSSHHPDDLWHLVTTDYMHANIWLQLTSGDNIDMTRVVDAVDQYLLQNPPPVPLKHRWAGLTYINIVWQKKMVFGMLQSFLGSFLVVFIMMAILFRSVLWGLICMIPLTVTIALIYGIIGLIGKDYDMPVAVLSALTLGMAVDFAIHFLQRTRDIWQRTGSWSSSVGEMFGEPARAISRNVLVIAIGFLPLLAAPLVPYKTVGIFLCAIMALSGMITLFILPAVLNLGEKWLFKPQIQAMGMTCNCVFCVVIAIATVILVALNLHQYSLIGWSKLSWFSLFVIPILALLCGVMSRRQVCKRHKDQNNTQQKEPENG